MSKRIIFSKDAPEPIGPYSQAVQVGNLVFVSGQVALDAATGDQHTSNIETETHQVMENIKAILNAAGLNFSHVVKVSIFLKNMDDFSRMNKVYSDFFSDAPPARETVEVSRLPKNVNVEISCVASAP